MTQGLSRWRQLLSQLEAEIRAGTRPPGSKLPSIAQQQVDGISQTTTLRAYGELVSMGLAASIPGSGTYVADPLPVSDPEMTLEALANRIRRIEEHLGISPH